MQNYIHINFLILSHRVIREISRELFGKDYRWTLGALQAIHEGSEAFLITNLEYGNLAAIHMGRVTIMKKDLDLVMQITEVTGAYKTDIEVTGEKARDRKCLAL